MSVMTIPADLLFTPCPVEWLTTAADGDGGGAHPGQKRALDALTYGLDLHGEGYNLYISGPPASGKYEMVRRVVEEVAADRPVPADICYVNNFASPHQPRMLNLPAGRGRQLRSDMRELVESLLITVPEALRGDEFKAQLDTIRAGYQEQENNAFEKLSVRAVDKGFILMRTPGGYTIAPMKDGKPMGKEDLEQLSEEESNRLQENLGELNKDLQDTVKQIPAWQTEAREKVRAAESAFSLSIIGPAFAVLEDVYQDLPAVIVFLREVRASIIENISEFKQTPELLEKTSMRNLLQSAEFTRYQVNLLIDHSQSGGSPVLYEPNPTYQKLFGRIEHRSQFGTLSTDFSMIKPGALHAANGGYLILDMRKLLMHPLAWDGLKRVLSARQVPIEPIETYFGMTTVNTLEPEPAPLEVKVLLLGDRQLEYLLRLHDEEFGRFFKICADFSDDMDRDRAGTAAYGEWITALARRQELGPLEPDAIGRIIEHSSREAGDARKISLQTGALQDLLQESAYFCRRAGDAGIRAEHVETALEKRRRHTSRLREQSLESLKRGTLMIDLEGQRIGQVNGLSVVMAGAGSFGKPSRITATARSGQGRVVDIEREAELGGPIHSKGVMILSSWLADFYSPDRPLSLQASLVFEQSYGFVEGDSASLAELCALLSAIGRIPLLQSLAITGSVNQMGDVQAIGGVNEKIEGFFDSCEQSGLTGDQGVIIPRANLDHLMLDRRVVDACREGRFRIIAVTGIADVIELLAGIPAGDRNEDGRFPAGSCNALIQSRLQTMAAIQQSLKEGDHGKES